MPTSAVARAATAGLLAIAALLFPGSHGALTSAVSDARNVTAALVADLDVLGDRLGALPSRLESEVADAIDSARAATDAARSALAGVPDSEDPDPVDAVQEGRAVLALSDAQVAVEAAAAQVRHVREIVGDTPTISDALGSLQDHLDALRLQQPPQP